MASSRGSAGVVGMDQSSLGFRLEGMPPQPMCQLQLRFMPIDLKYCTTPESGILRNGFTIRCGEELAQLSLEGGYWGNKLA